MRVCECADPARCEGDCGAHVPIDREGRICVVTRAHIGHECHVEWASYILAWSRVEWLKEALADSSGEGRDAVYCDTDSLQCLERRTRRVGSGLGRWECKGRNAARTIHAPKLYAYRDETGKLHVKAKGLNLPRKRGEGERAEREHQEELEKAWKKIVRGRTLGAVGIIGLAKGARQGRFFERARTGRCAHRGYGDRILEPGSSVTRAPTIEEVRSGAATRRNGKPRR